MFYELAHFKYPTHYAYVFQHQDSGCIHCLKYNSSKLEWTYYNYEEWESCKEHMIRGLEPGSWGFEPEV